MALSAEYLQTLSRGANHAMVWACKKDSPRELSAALSAGADLSSPEAAEALYRACLQGHARCVKALLDAGMRADRPSQKHFGQQALQAAISKGRLDCVRLTLPTGDLDRPNCHGRRPLEEALGLWQVDIAQMIQEEALRREAKEIRRETAAAPSKGTPRL